MKAGFAKSDITPRVGGELYGFGPFLMRRSIAVRDRLWARAAVFEMGGKKMAMVSCDLVGVTRRIVKDVRGIISKEAGIPPEAVMLHCTHTHSGPNTSDKHGWGEPDHPYLEVIARKIAKSIIDANSKLQPVKVSYAEVPCEGIGLNREYDIDAPPLEEVLKDDWRPAKPELTDTTCHVISYKDTSGKTVGFMTYFGCHPVVCCQTTRYIHGDYAGVGTNTLERENPGSVGMFLQGAQGDVNSCVVHKPEAEALLALDVIASRFANSVRHGLNVVEPIEVDGIGFASNQIDFSRKQLGMDYLKDMLAEQEAVLHAPGAEEDDQDVRMATVFAISLRSNIEELERGGSMSPLNEVQGMRVGPLKFLASSFETFQAIKNDVKANVTDATALVMGITNGMSGYAPDRTVAARGGYAADMVPLILGYLPYSDIHTELVQALTDLAGQLN